MEQRREGQAGCLSRGDHVLFYVAGSLWRDGGFLMWTLPDGPMSLTTQRYQD